MGELRWQPVESFQSSGCTLFYRAGGGLCAGSGMGLRNPYYFRVFLEAENGSFRGRKCCGIETGDAAFGTYDERERERVPVAVVEGLPGSAIVVADVAAVGAGGYPKLERLGPLDGGAVAVGRGGRGFALENGGKQYI